MGIGMTGPDASRNILLMSYVLYVADGSERFDTLPSARHNHLKLFGGYDIHKTRWRVFLVYTRVGRSSTS